MSALLLEIGLFSVLLLLGVCLSHVFFLLGVGLFNGSLLFWSRFV